MFMNCPFLIFVVASPPNSVIHPEADPLKAIKMRAMNLLL